VNLSQALLSLLSPLPIRAQTIQSIERGAKQMFEITVEAGFSSGHYLRNYKGKCENPHGHNYRVLVTLAGEELDEAGLLLDFKLLKTLLRPVVERLDHRMINDIAPFTELNPSAENLARYFYQQTSRQLDEMTGGRVRVKDCTLFETDTSFARYYE
jgi:6-pyruvoyltetrahydropterin/6-carboxytetrahydropterin synthase